jgi:hypothetical protein
MEINKVKAKPEIIMTNILNFENKPKLTNRE